MSTAVHIGRDPHTPPHPPVFGLIYEGIIGQPRQTTSLCDPLLPPSLQFRTVAGLGIELLEPPTLTLTSLSVFLLWELQNHEQKTSVISLHCLIKIRTLEVQTYKKVKWIFLYDVIHVFLPLTWSQEQRREGQRPWSSPAYIQNCWTDKKVKKIFLVYQEIQKGSGAKSYLTNGLLIFAHFLIYKEALRHIALSYMTLHPIPSEFPYVRGKFSFLF